MSKISRVAASEADIFRRIVDRDELFLTPAAAQGILRLDFSTADRQRMNELAARNREGRVSDTEEQELGNYIRVGQILGILRSKARRSLRNEPLKKRSKS
jgi:hypothetical protein